MDHSRATRAEAGLLASLQAPRQSHALAGKLKTVTVPTFEEYGHLARAVQVREMDPRAEVRSLPQDVRPIVGAPLAGIRAMREDRKRRHELCILSLEEFDKDMANRLVVAVQVAIGEFQKEMEANDIKIDGRLERLKNSRIAEIDEEGIQTVFNFMLQQRSVRNDIFEKMSHYLSKCDEECRKYASESFYNAIEALSAAAHIPDTSIQRLIEELSYKTNVTILEWRKANADLLRRLRVRNIEMERSRRILSNDILIKWRRDRTDHAILVFCQDLRSERFVRPDGRTRVLDELTKFQNDCMQGVYDHILAAKKLFPLKTKKSTGDWATQSDNCVIQWKERSSVCMEKVRQVEVETRQLAESHFSDLVNEIKRYGYISEDKVKEYLEKECHEPMNMRENHAKEVIAILAEFVDEQRIEWKSALETLASYMEEVQTLRETQRKNIHDINNRTKDLLVKQREEHESNNKKNEIDFDGIIAEIQVATSESIMDKKVEEALSQLDVIEESYRNFHALSSSTLKKHVQAIKDETNSYEMSLCKLLGLSKHERRDDEVEDTAVVIRSGSEYVPMTNLYNSLFQVETSSSSSTEQTPKEEDGDGAVGGESAEQSAVDVTTEDENGNSPKIDGETEKLMQGVKESEKSVSSEVAAYLLSPTSSKPYNDLQNVPVQLVESVLEHLQQTMIEDMNIMCDADVTCSIKFSSTSNEVLTNELDTLLRQHRPRAGRVEEEVRQECSVKLIQLRRKFDRQIRRAIKQLADNDHRIEESLKTLSASMSKQIARLKRLESSLASCMSVKSLTTRVREARSTRDQLHELLKQECEGVRKYIAKQTKDISEVKDNLHTFLIIDNKPNSETIMSRDELLSQEGYEEYAKQLEQFSQSISQQADREVRNTKSSENALAAEIDENFAAIESAIVHHETDLKFLEEFDSVMYSTRNKVKDLIQSGEIAEKELDNDVENLKSALQYSSSSEIGQEDTMCDDMMAKLDKLRLRLLSRCKRLKYVQSNIEPTTIPHTFHTASASESISESKADKASTQSAKSSNKETSKSGSKDAGKSSKDKSKSKPAPVADDGNSSSLLATVDTLCEECSTSLKEAATAFYEQKVAIEASSNVQEGASSGKKRHRIPDTLDDFNLLCEEQLSQLRADAHHHVSRSIHTLHESVMNVNELITKVPMVALKLILSGKQFKLEKSIEKAIGDFDGKKSECELKLDRLKSKIRILMVKREQNNKDVADSSQENATETSSLEAKEAQLKELFAEEEKLCLECIEIEKEQAEKEVELLSNFENDVSIKLRTLMKVIVEEMSNIVLPEDLPQEHVIDDFSQSENAKSDNKQASDGNEAHIFESLWNMDKRKGLKKLLQQKAFGDLGESETAVAGRPLRQLTWRVRDAYDLAKSIKISNLITMSPLKFVSNSNLEEVELNTTLSTQMLTTADELTSYSVTGLDCCCVHALVSARDEVLETMANLNARVYNTTRSRLLSKTTQYMNTNLKWKEAMQQHKQLYK